MNAAWVGYFIGAAAGYGLVSRVFVFLLMRRHRTVARALGIHAVIGALIGYTVMRDGDPSALMFVPAILLWLFFDLWRVRLKGRQA